MYTLVHHIWLGVYSYQRRLKARSKLENLDEASTGEACVAEEGIEGLEPLRERERLLIVHVFDDGGGVYFSVVRGGFQTAAAVFIIKVIIVVVVVAAALVVIIVGHAAVDEHRRYSLLS